MSFIDPWTNLLLKEATLLILLSLLGSGFVTFLRGQLSSDSRLALTPIFGLAAAGVTLTTASYFVTMSTAAWLVLLPLTAASVAVTYVKARRDKSLMRLNSNALKILLIFFVVSTAFNYPLVASHSVGPVGYRVYDATGYTTDATELAHHTTKSREFEWEPTWDLTARAGANYRALNQQIGYNAVTAATNSLLGWQASSTQSAFMIVLIIIGALGVFASVQGISRKRSWLALTAAFLYAGPMNYQLFIDGSEASLSGLVLIGPIALLVTRLLTRFSKYEVVALGILLAAAQTLYPLWAPTLALWGLLLIGAAVVVWLFSHRLNIKVVGSLTFVIASLVVLTIVVSPHAFIRNWEYWTTAQTFIKGAANGLPVFRLPFQVLPGYVLQMREFFNLAVLNGSPQLVLTNVIAPILLTGVIAFGVIRYLGAKVLLPLVIAATVLALYADAKLSCSYCVQRNLLVLGPALAMLLTLGTIALYERGKLLKVVAVSAAIGIVAVAGYRSFLLAQRAIQGGYALPDAARKTEELAKGKKGPILLEAVGSSLSAAIEMPLLYHSLNEQTDQRLAMDVEADDFRGLAYLGGPRDDVPALVGSVRKNDAQFVSDYRFIFSRAGAIQTGRELVGRHGPYSFQKRRTRLDATVTSNILIDNSLTDKRGVAWVNSPKSPLVFRISGKPGLDDILKLELKGPAAHALHVPDSVRVLRRTGKSTVLCVPIPDKASYIRRVLLKLKFAQVPAKTAKDKFALPLASKSLSLTTMTAGATCSK